MNLKINDRIQVRTVDFFDSFKLRLRFDSIADTFSFSAYFDPKNKFHAETFCVSHFHEAIVEHNGKLLITGYLLGNAFNQSEKKELTHIGGYSKPGVLEDCDIPTTLYPLETNGLSLKQITERLIKPFGLKLVIDADVNKESSTNFINAPDPNVDENGFIADASAEVAGVIQSLSLSEKSQKKIDKANAKESQNIKSFLTDLAVQRNILLSHDASGNLLFTEAKTHQKPILHFDGGGLIGTTMSLSFGGQQLHSHITIIKQADSDGGDAEEYTIRNPYVPILYRPKVLVMSSGDNITIQEFAQKALAIELKNIVLTITTDRWEVDNDVVTPNNIISVINPELFIYKKTNFFIEQVDLEGDAKKTIATYTCVLPEVYNGQLPKNIFVDPHKNLPRV